MSKVILVCFRDAKDDARYRLSLRVLADRLAPNNISPYPPSIDGDNKGVLIAVISPNDTLSIKNTSVCLGQLINPKEDWWSPGTEAPDGSYALFRSDDRHVELLSDVVASRTIWYAKTEHCFLASSSQRAIVSLLQDFQPNYETSLWMLSSGSLGPGQSWDSRIGCLYGDSRLRLNRTTWETSHEVAPVSFEPVDLSTEEHEARLNDVLARTFGNLHLYSNWVLPLSGGFDSRALLLLLNNRSNIQTITWGLKSSLMQPNSDAYVARSLASQLNVRNRYFELDTTNESIETVFERFLVMGEGRGDWFGGYTDGFSLWKTLFEEKIVGIIRGDEGFGWTAVRNNYEVKASIGAIGVEDLWQLDALTGLGLQRLGKQKWPDSFRRRESESLSTWRDRLYHQWRIPFRLAALNELKTSYVEVANPFLSRDIIAVIRTMPDSLRTNKTLFRRIVENLGPRIEFAKFQSIPERGDILSGHTANRLIMDELSSSYATSLLPVDFLRTIRDKISKIDGNPEEWRSRAVRQTVSAFLKLLTYRAYIVCKMNRLMVADADALKAYL
jgi:hypothetical protein